MYCNHNIILRFWPISNCKGIIMYCNPNLIIFNQYFFPLAPFSGFLVSNSLKILCGSTVLSMDSRNMMSHSSRALDCPSTCTSVPVEADSTGFLNIWIYLRQPWIYECLDWCSSWIPYASQEVPTFNDNVMWRNTFKSPDKHCQTVVEMISP